MPETLGLSEPYFKYILHMASLSSSFTSYFSLHFQDFFLTDLFGHPLSLLSLPGLLFDRLIRPSFQSSFTSTSLSGLLLDRIIWQHPLTNKSTDPVMRFFFFFFFLLIIILHQQQRCVSEAYLSSVLQT